MKPFNRSLFDKFIDASMRDLTRHGATGRPSDTMGSVTAFIATSDDGNTVINAESRDTSHLHRMGGLGEILFNAMVASALEPDSGIDAIIHVCPAWVVDHTMPTGEIENDPDKKMGYAIALYSRHDVEIRAYLYENDAIMLKHVEHFAPLTERQPASAEGQTVH